MPKIFPVIVKRTTTVSGGSANAVWPETVDMSDPNLISHIPNPDTVDATDTISQETLVVPETANMPDGYVLGGSVVDPDTTDFSEAILPNLTPNADSVNFSDSSSPMLAAATPNPDTVNFSEPAIDTSLTANVDDLQFSESGVGTLTTSNGNDGDTWLDQANANTAHGSDTTLKAKGATVTPGSDEQRAYIEYDLSKFANLTATSTVTFTINASTSNGLLATSLTWTARSGSTQPFSESAATWTGKAAALETYGTSRATGTISVAVGAAADYTFTLTAGQMNSAITDGFLVFIFKTAGGVTVDTVTINSKENAASRPRISFSFSR